MRAATVGPPPSDFECPQGSTRIVTVERAGTRSLPTAAGHAEPLSPIAKTVWCAGDDGRATGPLSALDARGRVVRSGQHEGGEPVGAWIAWNVGGQPLAVTVYRKGGELAGEDRCGPALRGN